MRLILTSWAHLPRWEGWCPAPARLGSDLHILFEAAITQVLSDTNLKCKHENSRILLAHEGRRSAGRAKPSNTYICTYESEGKICRALFLDPCCYKAAVALSWWQSLVMLQDVMCVMKTLLHVTMDWNTLMSLEPHTIKMDPRMNCKFKTQLPNFQVLSGCDTWQ